MSAGASRRPAFASPAASDRHVAWRRRAAARGVIAVVLAAEALAQLVILWQALEPTGLDDDAVRWTGTVALASYLVTVVFAVALIVVNARARRAVSQGAALVRLRAASRVVAWSAAARIVVPVGLLIASAIRIDVSGMGIGMLATFDAVLSLVLAVVTASQLSRASR